MTEVTAPVFKSGFMVLHGNRLEDLRDLLSEFLRAQPLPPLVPEVILVQSNGMKHWLEMALADDAALGICAATRLELPSGYLWQVYRSVLGAETVPAHMPFDKSHLVWRLVRLLPVLADSQPVYAPLQRYLALDADGRKLYQLALQVADVFDAYQSYRADWLTDWAAGHDVLRGHDGQPAVLADAHKWQARLWRDLRADVGPGLADASRASVHARFMATLQAQLAQSQATGQRPAGLPPRLVVFGISSLPMQTVEALAQLGQVCQVLMLVQNPCQYYWGDIVSGHDQLRAQLHHRQAARPMASDSHPLLASWGKQGRDYLHLLDDFDNVALYRQRMHRVDVFVDPVHALAAPTLLNQLQSGILNLEPAHNTLDAKREVPPDDNSISFVTCHSAQREVEVLHDRLLAWFDADPALSPRDVMVMVPDMAAFAPHIQAVFGRFATGQVRHIPYSVADTTPRQSPLVQALEQLLSLPNARVSLADWLGLFEVAAVRQRFGLDEADVAQLHDWLAMAGVRWGLDAQHRMAWGVPAGVPGLDQNSWAFGLRRLLLGYAVGAGAPWGNTLPQAALNGLDANVISALLDWVAAVNQTLQELSGSKPPADWGLTLAGVVERFFAAADDVDERLIQRCLAPLEVWQQACDAAQLETPLPLDVVREHWLSQIEESSLQQRFFGGGVQFGTLMPMRSIPFQVICLLGMNDGDYPRQQAPRDFDLMAQSWRAGDRSRREDDRYLFLEALLSARQKLYISWQGHRATDNSEQPPSVLVAQLLDYLQMGWQGVPEPQQQPLQAFSEAYFLQDSPFASYANDWARVHEQAAPQTPQAGPPALAAPTALALADLRQLLRQPVEVFFKSRLRVWLDTLEELEQTEEPFALNGLEQYQAGQALLDATELPQALEHMRLSGQLPMAAFGQRLATELQAKTQVVLDRQGEWTLRYPEPLPAQSIELQVGGISLTGTLEGIYHGEGGWLQMNQRVGAVLEGEKEARTARAHVVVGLWLQHLAACASAMPLTSVQLGLDGQVIFAPLPQADALRMLQGLVTAYLAAWERPLPVACKSAWAYLQAQAQAARLAATDPDKEPKDPHEAAQAVFEGARRAGERAESAYLARAFESYDEIEAELPDWAERLYGDMARHIQLTPSEGGNT
ncbi:exodeoxyribonuclease V subunit gamma [Rhodoferax sp.]|uniref:exodeoxyribonuclease V subunit gamma n=1 Tax=Rhodoferax sp. TaxID=50421 RepID=UPI00273574C7|nr:exodeoxyribonuclease V subunit gamma [Rhodoferax sp.]MDP3191445.1 exodeoxyribonuclease V subunit gamma [Rhodoferax sp.]MDP3336905.1 exodeoxyribonuclease V subunit gamma [Rhodoferax sp.]